MFKQRREAAQKVAENLFAVEDAIDIALARAAEFSASMVTARTDAGLSALVGQDAFETSAAAFAALARARKDMVETHKHLSDTKIQIGMRTLAMGDLAPKPPVEGRSDDGRHIRAVA